MAENKFYNEFMALPPMARGIISVIVVGGVAFIGYKIYKNMNKTDTQKADQQLQDAITTELAKAKLKFKPTFQDSEYLLMADLIHNSIKFCLRTDDNYGAAEDALKKMQNDLDVLLLMNAFGTRTSYCFGIPRDTYKLFTFIQNTLGDEFFGLTSYRVTNINNDWKNKGITFQL